jgi:hypothetical protein
LAGDLLFKALQKDETLGTLIMDNHDAAGAFLGVLDLIREAAHRSGVRIQDVRVSNFQPANPAELVKAKPGEMVAKVTFGRRGGVA